MSAISFCNLAISFAGSDDLPNTALSDVANKLAIKLFDSLAAFIKLPVKLFKVGNHVSAI